MDGIGSRACPTSGDKPDYDEGKAVPRDNGHTAFAISRNLNFWILPVLVFGISANTT